MAKACICLLLAVICNGWQLLCNRCCADSCAGWCVVSVVASVVESAVFSSFLVYSYVEDQHLSTTCSIL